MSCISKHKIKMKNDLFLSENDDLRLSSLFVGYEILKQFNRNSRMTIYDLYNNLRKRQPNLNHPNFMNSLTFLYMSGIIEFKKPYIEVVE